MTKEMTLSVGAEYERRQDAPPRGPSPPASAAIVSLAGDPGERVVFKDLGNPVREWILTREEFRSEYDRRRA